MNAALKKTLLINLITAFMSSFHYLIIPGSESIICLPLVNYEIFMHSLKQQAHDENKAGQQRNQ